MQASEWEHHLGTALAGGIRVSGRVPHVCSVLLRSRGPVDYGEGKCACIVLTPASEYEVVGCVMENFRLRINYEVEQIRTLRR